MPSGWIKFVAVLAVFAVAPASGHRMLAAGHDHRSCVESNKPAQAQQSSARAGRAVVVTLPARLSSPVLGSATFVTP
jgi:hypothetical protein